METVRRDLAAALAGAQVTSVVVSGKRSVRRNPAAFAGGLTGRRLVSFGRHGKYLLIGLDSDDVLVVHLRMSGQLLLSSGGEEAAAAPPRHTHVVLSLADGRVLRFVDPRTFGEMFVTSAAVPELAALGIDALELSPERLASLLAGRRAALKPLLLDQRVIAGIGNIYSDEILFAAGLRWSRQASSLRRREIARLSSAVSSVLGAAIEARGSSLGDNQYVDLSGAGGAFAASHQVYGRPGQPCPRCARPIERVTVAQRSHHFCRRCQR